MRYLISLLFAGVALPAFAFHGAIQGRVYNYQGTPLAGAQVWLEGYPIGTTTDTAGRYYIEVPMHGEFRVVYQFIGFKSETLKVFVGHGELVNKDVRLKETPIPLTPVETRAQREMLHESKTPEPAVVIPKIAAEKTGKATIGEAATLSAGVQLQKRCSACEASEVSIHGLPGRFSLILLEGMPVFSGLASRYILDLLPVDFIDRLEILKGAAGAIWGSDAIAGAVNVILPQPVQPFEAKASYTYRSYGNDLSALIGSNLKPFGINVIGAHRNNRFVDINQDTIAENTAFKRNLLLTNIYYYHGTAWRFHAGALVGDETRRAGAIIPDSLYPNTPNADKIHTRRWDLWQKSGFLAGEREVTLRLAFNHHQENGIIATRDYTARQTNFYSEITGKLPHLTLGTAFAHQRLDDTRLVFDDYREDNLGIWAAGNDINPVLLSIPVDIMPAVRLDLNSRFGTIISPYAAVKIYPGFVDFNIAGGTGFRTPTIIWESMENLPNGYQYVIQRDPDITKESGISLQAGAARRLTGNNLVIDLQLNIFHHQVDRLIAAEFRGIDTVSRRALFYYHNLDETALSSGAEFSLRGVFVGGLSANLNAYFLFPRNRTGATLPFVRRWAGNYSLNYKIARWQAELNLSSEINGPMLVQSISGGNVIRTYDSPVYPLLNIRVTKELSLFRFSAGVNNIGNYYQPPLSHHETKAEYYWGPIIGRELYVTIGINI